jgi:hypothetical protein
LPAKGTPKFQPIFQKNLLADSCWLLPQVNQMHVSTSLDPGPWPDRIWWQCAAVDIHLLSGCFQLLPCLCGALLGLVLGEHYTPLATRLRRSMLHCMSVCQWTSGPKARLLLCVSWHWDLTPDALVRQQSWNTALWQASGSGRHVPFRHRQSLKCCGIPVTEHQSGTRWFWMSSTFVFIWCSVKQTFGFKSVRISHSWLGLPEVTPGGRKICHLALCWKQSP